MISSWLLQHASIRKEIFLPSTKQDEWSLQSIIHSPKLTAVQREATIPCTQTFPSSPFVTHLLLLLPIYPTCIPAVPLSTLRTNPHHPPPAYLCISRGFLHCWELDYCPYLFGSLFTKRWRWPHGVVFSTSLLLPFIITGHWSLCVFSNAV